MRFYVAAVLSAVVLACSMAAITTSSLPFGSETNHTLEQDYDAYFATPAYDENRMLLFEFSAVNGATVYVRDDANEPRNLRETAAVQKTLIAGQRSYVTLSPNYWGSKIGVTLRDSSDVISMYPREFPFSPSGDTLVAGNTLNISNFALPSSFSLKVDLEELPNRVTFGWVPLLDGSTSPELKHKIYVYARPEGETAWLTVRHPTDYDSMLDDVPMELDLDLTTGLYQGGIWEFAFFATLDDTKEYESFKWDALEVTPYVYHDCGLTELSSGVMSHIVQPSDCRQLFKIPLSDATDDLARIRIRIDSFYSDVAHPEQSIVLSTSPYTATADTLEISNSAGQLDRGMFVITVSNIFELTDSVPEELYVMLGNTTASMAFFEYNIRFDLESYTPVPDKTFGTSNTWFTKLPTDDDFLQVVSPGQFRIPKGYASKLGVGDMAVFEIYVEQPDEGTAFDVLVQYETAMKLQAQHCTKCQVDSQVPSHIHHSTNGAVTLYFTKCSIDDSQNVLIVVEGTSFILGVDVMMTVRQAIISPRTVNVNEVTLFQLDNDVTHLFEVDTIFKLSTGSVGVPFLFDVSSWDTDSRYAIETTGTMSLFYYDSNLCPSNFKVIDNSITSKKQFTPACSLAQRTYFGVVTSSNHAVSVHINYNASSIDTLVPNVETRVIEDYKTSGYYEHYFSLRWPVSGEDYIFVEVFDYEEPGVVSALTVLALDGCVSFSMTVTNHKGYYVGYLRTVDMNAKRINDSVRQDEAFFLAVAASSSKRLSFGIKATYTSYQSLTIAEKPFELEIEYPFLKRFYITPPTNKPSSNSYKYSHILSYANENADFGHHSMIVAEGQDPFALPTSFMTKDSYAEETSGLYLPPCTGMDKMTMALMPDDDDYFFDRFTIRREDYEVPIIADTQNHALHLDSTMRKHHFIIDLTTIRESQTNSEATEAVILLSVNGNYDYIIGKSEFLISEPFCCMHGMEERYGYLVSGDEEDEIIHLDKYYNLDQLYLTFEYRSNPTRVDFRVDFIPSGPPDGYATITSEETLQVSINDSSFVGLRFDVDDYAQFEVEIVLDTDTLINDRQDSYSIGYILSADDTTPASTLRGENEVSVLAYCESEDVQVETKITCTARFTIEPSLLHNHKSNNSLLLRLPRFHRDPTYNVRYYSRSLQEIDTTFTLYGTKYQSLSPWPTYLVLDASSKFEWSTRTDLQIECNDLDTCESTLFNVEYAVSLEGSFTAKAESVSNKTVFALPQTGKSIPKYYFKVTRHQDTEDNAASYRALLQNTKTDNVVEITSQDASTTIDIRSDSDTYVIIEIDDADRLYDQHLVIDVSAPNKEATLSFVTYRVDSSVFDLQNLNELYKDSVNIQKTSEQSYGARVSLNFAGSQEVFSNYWKYFVLHFPRKTLSEALTAVVSIAQEAIPVTFGTTVEISERYSQMTNHFYSLTDFNSSKLYHFTFESDASIASLLYDGIPGYSVDEGSLTPINSKYTLSNLFVVRGSAFSYDSHLLVVRSTEPVSFTIREIEITENTPTSSISGDIDWSKINCYTMTRGENTLWTEFKGKLAGAGSIYLSRFTISDADYVFTLTGISDAVEMNSVEEGSVNLRDVFTLNSSYFESEKKRFCAFPANLAYDTGKVAIASLWYTEKTNVDFTITTNDLTRYESSDTIDRALFLFDFRNLHIDRFQYIEFNRTTHTYLDIGDDSNWEVHGCNISIQALDSTNPPQRFHFIFDTTTYDPANCEMHILMPSGEIAYTYNSAYQEIEYETAEHLTTNEISIDNTNLLYVTTFNTSAVISDFVDFSVAIRQLLHRQTLNFFFFNHNTAEKKEFTGSNYNRRYFYNADDRVTDLGYDISSLRAIVLPPNPTYVTGEDKTASFETVFHFEMTEYSDVADSDDGIECSPCLQDTLECREYCYDYLASTSPVTRLTGFVASTSETVLRPSLPENATCRIFVKPNIDETTISFSSFSSSETDVPLVSSYLTTFDWIPVTPYMRRPRATVSGAKYEYKVECTDYTPSVPECTCRKETCHIVSVLPQPASYASTATSAKTAFIDSPLSSATQTTDLSPSNIDNVYRPAFQHKGYFKVENSRSNEEVVYPTTAISTTFHEVNIGETFSARVSEVNPVYVDMNFGTKTNYDGFTEFKFELTGFIDERQIMFSDTHPSAMYSVSVSYRCLSSSYSNPARTSGFTEWIDIKLYGASYHDLRDDKCVGGFQLKFIANADNAAASPVDIGFTMTTTRRSVSNFKSLALNKEHCFTSQSGLHYYRFDVNSKDIVKYDGQFAITYHTRGDDSASVYYSEAETKFPSMFDERKSTGTIMSRTCQSAYNGLCTVSTTENHLFMVHVPPSAYPDSFMTKYCFTATWFDVAEVNVDATVTLDHTTAVDLATFDSENYYETSQYDYNPSLSEVVIDIEYDSDAIQAIDYYNARYAIAIATNTKIQLEYLTPECLLTENSPSDQEIMGDSLNGMTIIKNFANAPKIRVRISSFKDALISFSVMMVDYNNVMSVLTDAVESTFLTPYNIMTGAVRYIYPLSDGARTFSKGLTLDYGVSGYVEVYDDHFQSVRSLSHAMSYDLDRTSDYIYPWHLPLPTTPTSTLTMDAQYLIIDCQYIMSDTTISKPVHLKVTETDITYLDVTTSGEEIDISRGQFGTYAFLKIPASKFTSVDDYLFVEPRVIVNETSVESDILFSQSPAICGNRDYARFTNTHLQPRYPKRIDSKYLVPTASYSVSTRPQYCNFKTLTSDAYYIHMDISEALDYTVDDLRTFVYFGRIQSIDRKNSMSLTSNNELMVLRLPRDHGYQVKVSSPPSSVPTVQVGQMTMEFARVYAIDSAVMATVVNKETWREYQNHLTHLAESEPSWFNSFIFNDPTHVFTGRDLILYFYVHPDVAQLIFEAGDTVAITYTALPTTTLDTACGKYPVVHYNDVDLLLKQQVIIQNEVGRQTLPHPQTYQQSRTTYQCDTNLPESKNGFVKLRGSFSTLVKGYNVIDYAVTDEQNYQLGLYKASNSIEVTLQSTAEATSGMALFSIIMIALAILLLLVAGVLLYLRGGNSSSSPSRRPVAFA